MANFMQVDYGKAVRDGQAIQRGRIEKRLLATEADAKDYALAETKKEKANADRAKQIRREYKTVPDQISALEQEGLFDHADKLRDAHLARRTSEETLASKERGNRTGEQLDAQAIESGAVQNKRLNALQTLDAQSIERGRINNRLLSMGAAEKENTIKNRDRAKQIRQQVAGMPAQIEAMEKDGLFADADKLRESYIKTRVNEVKLLESLRKSITAANYKETRSKLLAAGAIQPEMMPVEYSDKWFRDQVSQNKSKLQQLTRQWGAKGVTMSQDLIAQDGSVIWEGEPYQDKSEAGGNASAFKMTASDTNAIHRQAGTLFGGIWDPATNRVGALNKDMEKQVQAITEGASQIYRANGGAITHAEAVSRAARKIGIKVPELGFAPPDANDPLGLLGNN